MLLTATVPYSRPSGKQKLPCEFGPQFHPQFGYPQYYRRIEWGSDVEASWEVTQFKVADEASHVPAKSY